MIKETKENLYTYVSMAKLMKIKDHENLFHFLDVLKGKGVLEGYFIKEHSICYIKLKNGLYKKEDLQEFEKEYNLEFIKMKPSQILNEILHVKEEVDNALKYRKACNEDGCEMQRIS
jgi:hypothetical protein